MKKPELHFRARWSSELAGYTHNTIRTYWPRLMAWYEYEDLMQEAQLVFVDCRNRYAETVDNPRWFMSLFKTAWRNRLLDLTASIPKYSLLEGSELVAEPQLDGPESMMLLEQALRALPLCFRLSMSDACRRKGRLKKIRPKALRQLRAALA